ncbi:hypothetical protein SAMN05216241_105103 [Limimonas halophila]|uniref:Uncharacterized protein n=1 Tax=Limimonas halophila TaxID=1082479 RepID=A0A1G7RG97_9PROT|nr:hypothetical protein [Limimonas halophila]SDG09159.1 hypothetical protein SAMN05216241_105103 [Limimonas halophila]
MADPDPNCVSPYLRRRLRSLEEARREREAPDAPADPVDPGGRADRQRCARPDGGESKGRSRGERCDDRGV